MKTDISPAIIMRVKNVGESDLLVTFFTPHKGRLKGVAKGAARSRKRFVNALDLFSLVSLEYAPRRQGDLFVLHSGRLLNPYPGLRADFSALAGASYMVELTEIIFPPGVAEPGMFDLLDCSFDALSEGKKRNLVPLIFEFKAMSLGGFRIDTTRCLTCGRRYLGEGTAVFKREKGGMACLRCEQPCAISPPLKPESVKALEMMQERSFSEALALDLDPVAVNELKAVFKLHREYRLEQKLRTSKYVES